MKGWSVVDSIAKKANRIAGVAQSHDDSFFLARLNFGKNINCIYPWRQRAVSQLHDFFSRQDLRIAAQNRARNGSGDVFVVTGNNLQGDAEILQLLDRLNHSRLRWIEKDMQRQKRHFRFTMLIDGGNGPEVPVRNSERAKTLATQNFNLTLDLALHLTDGAWSGSKCDGGAHLQHVVDRAFRNHEVAAVFGDQNAEPLAREVVRHFVDLRPSSHVKLPVLSNGLVDRVAETRFVKRIQIRIEKSFFVWLTFRIQNLLELDFSFGQRSCLVSAQNIHAAEILDRRQLLDDDLSPGHVHSSDREVDTDNRRQQLGNDADCYRECEKKWIDYRTVQVDRDAEDYEHQYQRYLSEQVAEATYAAFKLSLGGSQTQTFG